MSEAFQKSYSRKDFSNMNEVPSKFENDILQFPEHSYGVTRITILLDDGRMINDVFVAWGKEIIRVGTSKTILFDPEKIIEVRY